MCRPATSNRKTRCRAIARLQLRAVQVRGAGNFSWTGPAGSVMDTCAASFPETKQSSDVRAVGGVCDDSRAAERPVPGGGRGGSARKGEEEGRGRRECGKWEFGHREPDWSPMPGLRGEGERGGCGYAGSRRCEGEAGPFAWLHGADPFAWLNGSLIIRVGSNQRESTSSRVNGSDCGALSPSNC